MNGDESLYNEELPDNLLNCLQLLLCRKNSYFICISKFVTINLPFLCLVFKK